MKKSIMFILAVIMLCVSYSEAYACTSFAVYGQRTLYGMNFDYGDVNISYAISKSNGIKVFHMDFEISNNMSPTVAMNDKGLFSSIQMVYPETVIIRNPASNEVDMHNLAIQSIYSDRSVDDIKSYLEDKRVINQYSSIHNLFADTSGNAMVVEAGKEATLISEIEGNFMIMTNFFNDKLKNYPYNDLNEIGSDRYATAYEYITDNYDNFDIEHGFEVLKATAQSGAGFPTQSSMIFDPDNAEVYIAVKQNYEQIWKVSIKEGTIESYRGFNNPVQMELGQQGYTMDELVEFGEDNIMNSGVSDLEAMVTHTTSEDLSSDSTNIIYLIVPSAVIIVLLLVFIIIRRKRKDKSQ